MCLAQRCGWSPPAPCVPCSCPVCRRPSLPQLSESPRRKPHRPHERHERCVPSAAPGGRQRPGGLASLVQRPRLAVLTPHVHTAPACRSKCRASSTVPQWVHRMTQVTQTKAQEDNTYMHVYMCISFWGLTRPEELLLVRSVRQHAPRRATRRAGLRADGAAKPQAESQIVQVG
jgi:hypothetical protein